MKKFILVILLSFPAFCFAQTSYFIEAPVGYIRSKPSVTSEIIFKIGENEKVQVIEKTNEHWSKITYQQGQHEIAGYITNHTLTELLPAKETLIATHQQKSNGANK